MAQGPGVQAHVFNEPSTCLQGSHFLFWAHCLNYKISKGRLDDSSQCFKN